MNKIKIYKAKSVRDYIFLRKVRNLNLKFFTENKKYLSVFRQIYFLFYFLAFFTFFLFFRKAFFLIQVEHKNAQLLYV